MDTNYYSEKILSDFVIANLCQKDKLLQKYYSTSNISKFRKRFIRIGGSTKDIDTLVYAVITDSMRDLLIDIIGDLTEEIRPMGDIILTGGEAFNTYFSRDDRIVTSDIDAKFVPIFKLKSGKIVSIKNPKFFEYMQLVKLFLWDKMGKYAVKLSKLVEARIELIKKTKIGKIKIFFFLMSQQKELSKRKGGNFADNFKRGMHKSISDCTKPCRPKIL